MVVLWVHVAYIYTRVHCTYTAAYTMCAHNIIVAIGNTLWLWVYWHMCTLYGSAVRSASAMLVCVDFKGCPSVSFYIFCAFFFVFLLVQPLSLVLGLRVAKYIDD